MDKHFVFDNFTAFLPGVSAAVTFTDSRDIFAKPDAKPITTEMGAKRGVVPWGEDNKFPEELLKKIEKSPDLTSGLLFNITVGYGDGLLPCYISYSPAGKKIVKPYKLLGPELKQKIRELERSENTDKEELSELKQKYEIWKQTNKELDEFLGNNDIPSYLLEQITDMNHFYNVFPGIILNQETPEKRKIIEVFHNEATFSRWESMNPKTGKIENLFYQADWDKMPDKEYTEVVPVLDRKRTFFDLEERTGRRKRKDGKIEDDKIYRYIVPVMFPTPGKVYYQKPYWYSIIESGWYDFAVAIPEFKKALIENGMTIKYHIQLAHDYFDIIFAREGITSEKDKKARVKKEYTDIQNFLAGQKNTGKSLISYYKKSADGKPLPTITIEVIKNEFKGGEYLEDSSDASNMIAYSLGNHASLVGSAPARKGSNLSGTDKRELFIIKQALIKPFRDMLLKPFYLIKQYNKWDSELHFTIPNIVLTTLDEGKGSKEIS